MQHATVQPVPDAPNPSNATNVVDRSGCRAEAHGDERAYNDGCRCGDAREDHRRNKNHRRLYPRHVPAIGAIRRARALAVLGHSNRAVAAAAPGLDPQHVQELRRAKNANISRANHWRMMVAYRHLSRQPPTGTAQSVALIRNIAAREDWIGPDEWEPGELDDPNADPRAVDDATPVVDPDPLRVAQALDGMLYARDLTSAEFDAVIVGLREFGKSREDIAYRLDCTEQDIDTAETRIARAALREQAADLRAAGYTPQEAATQLGRALSVVEEAYRHFEIVELEAAVIAGHDAGISHGTTAAATGQPLREVVLTWKRLYPEAFDARVDDLRGCGLKRREIAQELGVGITTVLDACERLNAATTATDVAS